MEKNLSISLGFFERLPKKEASTLRKRKANLEKYFGGVQNMESIPDLVILVGQQRELNAVKECDKFVNLSFICILRKLVFSS